MNEKTKQRNRRVQASILVALLTLLVQTDLGVEASKITPKPQLRAGVIRELEAPKVLTTPSQSLATVAVKVAEEKIAEAEAKVAEEKEKARKKAIAKARKKARRKAIAKAKAKAKAKDPSQTAKEKISSLYISDNMDMSKKIGLTEEEIKYLLNESGLIKSQAIVDTLPKVLAETEINELFSISVMSLESGYFQSNYAVNYCNYGGLLHRDGSPMRFALCEEGLRAAIVCQVNNLHGGNIYEINDTYCPPNAEGNTGDYSWAESVLSIMRRYASVAK